MTPAAANELRNIIMLEDFVARREALDLWYRRWVATAAVQIKADGPDSLAVAVNNAKREIAQGLMSGEVPVFSFTMQKDSALGPQAVRAEIRIAVFRTEPFDTGATNETVAKRPS